MEIIDTKKGTVVWTDFLDSSVKDKIPESLIDALGNVTYTFYGFTHPLKEGTKSSGFAPLIKEEVHTIRETTTKVPREKYSNLDLLAGLSIHSLSDFSQPQGVELKKTGIGGGIGIKYNFVREFNLGFYFDGTKGDATVVRAGIGGILTLPVSEYVSPLLGLKLGWSGITYSDFGADYFFVAPVAGVDIGKKYGVQAMVEYNSLSEMKNYSSGYDFKSFISFLISARIGVW